MKRPCLRDRGVCGEWPVKLGCPAAIKECCLYVVERIDQKRLARLACISGSGFRRQTGPVRHIHRW